jgi:hypothetical protein
MLGQTPRASLTQRFLVVACICIEEWKVTRYLRKQPEWMEMKTWSHVRHRRRLGTKTVQTCLTYSITYQILTSTFTSTLCTVTTSSESFPHPHSFPSHVIRLLFSSSPKTRYPHRFFLVSRSRNSSTCNKTPSSPSQTKQ